MYTSWRDQLLTLLSYRRQRFPNPLFVPVAFTLLVASMVATDWPSVPRLVLRFAAAWLAVFTLRFWDDLEDVSRDRQLHPDRVLTRVKNLRPFVIFVGALFPVTGLLIHQSGGEPHIWMVLVVAMVGFYRLKVRTHGVGDFGILLKYPVLVLALGGSSQPVGWSVMALVLAAVVMDEVFQRPVLDRAHVAMGTVCLFGAAVAVVFLTGPNTISLVLQLALTICLVGLCVQSLSGKPFLGAGLKFRRVALLSMTLLILLLCNTSEFAGFLHAY